MENRKVCGITTLVAEIHRGFQVEVSLDAFAHKGNHRFPRFWGKGSQITDAFTQNWAEHGILWCNPPFSVLDKVVEKVRRDEGKIILICPDWQSQNYFWELQDMVVNKKFFPQGTSVYELDGKIMDPPAWGTWAFLLDANRRPPLRKILIFSRRKYLMN